jgi:glycosyltransferase involved in cell wall biosynthesis
MVRNPLFFSNFYLETILPLKSLAVRLEFRMRRWLIVLSVKSSDIVITASHSMLSDVRRFISIPNGGAAVNRFGVPLEKFNEGWDNAKRQGAKEADRLQQKSLRMLYVSEYSDHKNFTTLLRAVLLLRERGVDGFCLTTTADPDQFPDVEISSRAADRALSSDARISPYIKFVGSVSYEYIHMLYHENDLFVFPSLAESFGHPLVEAMASGLPIIASDIPIHREICGEAALYFSPLDPQDLVSKILILSDNVQLREHLGKTGRARAATQFSWKEHVQRQIVILKELANKDLKSRA